MNQIDPAPETLEKAQILTEERSIPATVLLSLLEYLIVYRQVHTIHVLG